jgi:hypothetical protein
MKITSSENDFTILPYSLNTPINFQLLNNDEILGYITFKNGPKFNYADLENTDAPKHWSLSIINELPYYEGSAWIVYKCSLEKTKLEFNKFLENSGETLHIDDWEAWSLEDSDSKVILVSSCEIY